jgi:hypothetical protein
MLGVYEGERAGVEAEMGGRRDRTMGSDRERAEDGEEGSRRGDSGRIANES